MISGRTLLIAHIGFPTEAFKAPLIYNPWFEKAAIDAVVVPMGSKADDYPSFFKALFRLTNIRGALITMPHKVTTVGLVDECSTAASIAGAVNAVLRREDGTLVGDMFDGTGFVRGLARKGFTVRGARGLVVGAGGVGSAIAASLAAEGAASLTIFDQDTHASAGLVERVRRHYPEVEACVGPGDPAGFPLVVNATPLGMREGDPLPFDVTRLSRETFVAEVVMKQEITPLLQAAKERGCRYQIGMDMLFEQIPAYLEFFGLGTATPDQLRAVSRITG